jgi:hypothetical protein
MLVGRVNDRACHQVAGRRMPLMCQGDDYWSMKFRSFLLSFCVAGIASISLAQPHHHNGSESVPPKALGKLGTVHFPISCSPSVQAPFERGVAMLHSFWYEEARKTIRLRGSV